MFHYFRMEFGFLYYIQSKLYYQKSLKCVERRKKMFKPLQANIIYATLEKLICVLDLQTGPFCLLFFGEPDISIPEED